MQGQGEISIARNSYRLFEGRVCSNNRCNSVHGQDHHGESVQSDRGLDTHFRIDRRSACWLMFQ